MLACLLGHFFMKCTVCCIRLLMVLVCARCVLLVLLLLLQAAGHPCAVQRWAAVICQLVHYSTPQAALPGAEQLLLPWLPAADYLCCACAYTHHGAFSVHDKDADSAQRYAAASHPVAPRSTHSAGTAAVRHYCCSHTV